MQLNEHADKGKTDPKPPVRAIDRAVDLGEQIEDPGQHLRRDPDSCIADSNDDLASGTARADRDATALIGVFGGVVQQIGEDLLQPSQIAFQRQRTSLNVDF